MKRIERLALGMGIGIAFSLHLSAAPAYGQHHEPPPIPPHSDDHGHHGGHNDDHEHPPPHHDDDHNNGHGNDDNHHGSSHDLQAPGGPDAWMSNIPATQAALATGILTVGASSAASTAAQHALLGFLAPADEMATAGAAAPGSAHPEAAAPGSAHPEAAAHQSEVVLSLTDAGAPSAEVGALTDAMAGILSQPRSDQLRISVDRFNKLVMKAPDRFLANPPPSFLAIHRVLTQLQAAPKTNCTGLAAADSPAPCLKAAEPSAK